MAVAGMTTVEISFSGDKPGLLPPELNALVYLISQVVLCGMSMANEPAGSPDGVGF